jgi:hypothetical protein
LAISLSAGEDVSPTLKQQIFRQHRTHSGRQAGDFASHDARDRQQDLQSAQKLQAPWTAATRVQDSGFRLAT